MITVLKYLLLGVWAGASAILLVQGTFEWIHPVRWVCGEPECSWDRLPGLALWFVSVVSLGCWLLAVDTWVR